MKRMFRACVLFFFIMSLALSGCAPIMVTKQASLMGDKMPCPDQKIYVGVTRDGTEASLFLAKAIQDKFTLEGFDVVASPTPGVLSILVPKEERFDLTSRSARGFFSEYSDAYMGSMAGSSLMGNGFNGDIISATLGYGLLQAVRLAQGQDFGGKATVFNFLIEVEYGFFENGKFSRKSALAVKGGTKKPKKPLKVYEYLSPMLAEDVFSRIIL